MAPLFSFFNKKSNEILGPNEVGRCTYAVLGILWGTAMRSCFPIPRLKPAGFPPSRASIFGPCRPQPGGRESLSTALVKGKWIAKRRGEHGVAESGSWLQHMQVRGTPVCRPVCRDDTPPCREDTIGYT